MRRIALAVSLSVLAATAPAVSATAAPQPVAVASAAPVAVPGEFLVGYTSGTTLTAAAAARSKARGTLVERVIHGRSDRREVQVVRMPAGQSLAAAEQALESQPGVAYVEPNWVLTTDATSNDPQITNGATWGMYGDSSSPANQYGSQAAEAWATGATGSSSVYVGVIDEGIDITHPDLAANVWQNPYDPVNGVDDDGNGYVDDSNGWDFVSNDRTVYDGSADDHGTHVSGTIGAKGGNAIGVAGVNWDVTLISGKFLGATGGTLADAVKAVDYMTDLKVRHGLNIVATSNSWGGGGYSQALHDAILRAAKADILFIAAAGNSTSNNDATANYPSNYSSLVGTSTQSAASYESVVAVASITNVGGISSFSSYGATTVDLGAPGSSIMSTLPGGTYGSYSGTSMATPHVSGAAALISATYGVTGAALRTRLLQAVTATPSLAGKTVTGGRLDLSLVSAVPLPPDTTAPSVTITSPAAGASLSTAAATTVTAAATDDRGVASVELWATPSGGTPVRLATDTTAPYSVSWKPSAAGSWTITAVATDTAGLTTTSSPVAVTAAAPLVARTLSVVAVTDVFTGTNKANLVVTVTVRNNLGKPVNSASVAAALYRNGAAKAYKTLSGFTDSSGVATFTVRSIPTGCYVTRISSVTSGSLVWDGVTPVNVTNPCK